MMVEELALLMDSVLSASRIERSVDWPAGGKPAGIFVVFGISFFRYSGLSVLRFGKRHPVRPGHGVSRFVMGVVVRASRTIDLFSESSRGPPGSRRLHESGMGSRQEL